MNLEGPNVPQGERAIHAPKYSNLNSSVIWGTYTPASPGVCGQGTTAIFSVDPQRGGGIPIDLNGDGVINRQDEIDGRPVTAIEEEGNVGDLAVLQSEDGTQVMGFTPDGRPFTVNFASPAPGSRTLRRRSWRQLR